MRFAKGLFIGVVHFFLATAGSAVFAAISFAAIKPLLIAVSSSSSAHDGYLLVLPLFPLQAIAGLSMGLFVSYRLNAAYSYKIAVLVWVLPAVWFVMHILTWPSVSTFGQSVWQHYLWSNEYTDKRAQLFTTLPFMTSASYSLGSWFAQRKGNAQAKIPN